MLTTLHCVPYQMKSSVGMLLLLLPILQLWLMLLSQLYSWSRFYPCSISGTRFGFLLLFVYISFVAMIVLKWLVRSVVAQTLDLTGCKKPLFMLVASIATTLFLHIYIRLCWILTIRNTILVFSLCWCYIYIYIKLWWLWWYDTVFFFSLCT